MEVSKAILSLDPAHDPLAVLLVIDNFAIRAHEYRWLTNFFDVMQKVWLRFFNIGGLDQNQSEPPSSSIRIRTQLTSSFQNDRNLDGFPNMAYSVALAHFHLKEYEKADEMLRKALLRFPNVVKAMADKNSVMMDRTSAGVFDKFYPENLLVDLYAER